MHKLNIDDYKEYVGLPKTFGLDVINPHQETSFRKRIYPFVSSELLNELKVSPVEKYNAIAKLIYKAAACYSVVIAVPFIKSKINSWGIDKMEGDKTKAG